MPGDQRFSVTFWGVRGSIACAGPQTVRYGGNTSCLEVMCGARRLIFDAGSGLPLLGRRLMSDGEGGDQTVFLTHTHLDHIIGLPFFVPFHIPGNRVDVHAGHLKKVGLTLHGVLSDMMRAPLFPVPPEIFAADMRYHDFESGQTIDAGDGVVLGTAPLNHPNGACGYRIEFGGRVLCYITDTEHYPDRRDRIVVDLVRDADVMIYDATYTDEEYPRFVGFGHSTWQEAQRIADEASVETVVLFHHDPSHDDAIMDRISADAEAARPGTVTAREGMTLEI